MEIQNLVGPELHKFHRKRNQVGYFPSIICLSISTYFQSEKLLIDHRWIFALALVIIGTILRVLIGEVFATQWENRVKWVRISNAFGFFCLGLGWGLHFSDVFFHYGADAPNVSYTLLIIVAFITGASTSLLADKVSYYIFITTMAASIILTYLTDPLLTNSYIILNVLIFLLFSITNYNITYKQLSELLISKASELGEKERLKKIINTVPGFVGLFDHDQVCTLANQATLSLYPDIIGKKIGQLDPNSQWEKFILDFILSDRVSEVSEQHTVFQGQDIYALLNVQKLEDGGVIVVSIITTELVLAQKRIKEQEARAQYSAKLASLGEMAAGIAHEVNNPLSIIQGSANIIKRLINEDPVNREHIQLLSNKMIETTDRISKTVKSLKALSRNGDNDPKAIFSLGSAISHAIDICEQKFKNEGIKLIQEIGADAKVLGREVQISQVLINLLNNSVDAIKNNESRWIKIKTQLSGTCIEILVIDSGKGIPPEIQQKIMEPFFTTKDVNHGTGLGLSISKSIMQEHQGELSFLVGESNTTFKIRLPVTDED